MLDSLADIWPWFGRRRAEKAASAETTSGGDEGTPWVAVAVQVGPAEAAIIKGRLDSEEIPAIVQQEALGIMLGLTVGPMGSARVLVPEPLAERALDILEETFDRLDDEMTTSADDQPDLEPTEE